MTLVQKEIKKIYVWKEPYTDYSAMRGPCPEGFHIPTSTELTNLLDAGYSCGAWINKNTSGDTTNLITRLKLPLAGNRMPYTTGNATNQGSYGFYHCCDQKSDTQAQSLLISSTTYNPPANASQWKGQGMSIRPFKDIAVIPDSSWTTIYKGTGSSGVYWNSSLGLISVSGDGATWYTIADKNLGATSVYNYGNTLSESNCGKYYQWGNNYGFPFTGSVTTSSTQVNASSYGPGNYYSSSTYITQQSSWDNPVNQNLRGGETGTTQGGGDIQIRPKVDTRTFTISWTEQSDMSSGWTYSDDATGLTAGDTAFDEFFGYYGCRLDGSGNETAVITQEESGGAGKLDITQLGTLTSGDNVMIAFPVMGIKMTKSGSTVTLSLTRELNKDGYQYYAHTKTGTIDNPGTPEDVLYIGAYMASNNGSNVLKSLSGKQPETNQTASTFCTRASANGSGYNITGYYQRQFINALYIMKYGNPYSQNVIGFGYLGYLSAYANTGGTNNQTNATYGTSSNASQIKLFGLEDRRGNKHEFIGGAYKDSSHILCTQLSGYTGGITGGTSTGDYIYYSGYNYLMSKVNGDNKALFGVRDTTAEGNYYNTWYCCSAMVRSASAILYHGTGRSDFVGFSVLALNAIGETGTNENFGGRIQYL